MIHTIREGHRTVKYNLTFEKKDNEFHAILYKDGTAVINVICSKGSEKFQVLQEMIEDAERISK